MRRRRGSGKFVRRPGRVRRYVARVYGRRAFDERGNIKPEYLERAERRAERSGNTSLLRAVVLARNFREWHHRR
ncbi:MAG: capsid protein VP2 [Conexivisphaera sp.]